MLEQDFESALAAIVSGYGEGVYEGCGMASLGGSLATESETSQFARALAGGDATFAG